jgi:surface polysaccharide O-acyltransferase-like enzyme
VSDPHATATNQGFGRVLVVIYAIFAIGATSRSVIQVSTRFDEAPIAYSLSTFAAVVYVIATIALARGHETSRRIAYVAISIEMVGVVIVGAASLLFPEAFPRASVWSYFGMGYLFIPLVLPIVGLWWLRKTTSAPA